LNHASARSRRSSGRGAAGARVASMRALRQRRLPSAGGAAAVNNDRSARPRDCSTFAIFFSASSNPSWPNIFFSISSNSSAFSSSCLSVKASFQVFGRGDFRPFRFRSFLIGAFRSGRESRRQGQRGGGGKGRLQQFSSGSDGIHRHLLFVESPLPARNMRVMVRLRTLTSRDEDPGPSPPGEGQRVERGVRFHGERRSPW